MDEIAKRWMIKKVHADYWRVARWIELDDLVQEGYLTYFRIKKRYDKVTSSAHLMRLFQVAFTNHLHRLSRTKLRCAPEVPVDSTPDVADDSNAMATLIAEAPPNVRKLLKTLEEIDPEVLREPYQRRANGTRETYNERLCRLAGIDPTTNVLSELQDYLA